jgi:hypothetical protein
VDVLVPHLGREVAEDVLLLLQPVEGEVEPRHVHGVHAELLRPGDERGERLQVRPHEDHLDVEREAVELGDLPELREVPHDLVERALAPDLREDVLVVAVDRDRQMVEDVLHLQVAVDGEVRPVRDHREEDLVLAGELDDLVEVEEERLSGRRQLQLPRGREHLPEDLADPRHRDPRPAGVHGLEAHDAAQVADVRVIEVHDLGETAPHLVVMGEVVADERAVVVLQSRVVGHLGKGYHAPGALRRTPLGPRLPAYCPRTWAARRKGERNEVEQASVRATCRTSSSTSWAIPRATERRLGRIRLPKCSRWKAASTL